MVTVDEEAAAEAAAAGDIVKAPKTVDKPGRPRATTSNRTVVTVTITTAKTNNHRGIIRTNNRHRTLK